MLQIWANQASVIVMYYTVDNLGNNFQIKTSLTYSVLARI